MGYSDFVIATPEPMLMLVLNLCPFTAGHGTITSAFWKKDGFCFVNLLIGLLTHWLMIVSYVWLYSFWLSLFGAILWIIPGVLMAIGYVLSGALLCLTIIGIPFGVQSIKMAGLALQPFGKRVVSSNDMANFYAGTA